MALKPFLNVTVMMSAARYLTLSMILPVLDGLKDYLQSTDSRLDGLRKILIDHLGVKFSDFRINEELRRHCGRFAVQGDLVHRGSTQPGHRMNNDGNTSHRTSKFGGFKCGFVNIRRFNTASKATNFDKFNCVKLSSQSISGCDALQSNEPEVALKQKLFLLLEEKIIDL